MKCPKTRCKQPYYNLGMGSEHKWGGAETSGHSTVHRICRVPHLHKERYLVNHLNNCCHLFVVTIAGEMLVEAIQNEMGCNVQENEGHQSKLQDVKENTIMDVKGKNGTNISMS